MLGFREKSIFSYNKKYVSRLLSLCLFLIFLVLVFSSNTYAQDNIGVTQEKSVNYFILGNEAYDNGEFKFAIKYYRAAIKNGQSEPFAWFNLGNTLVQLNKHHLAMVAFLRSSELAPEFVRPWAMLGDLYFVHDEMGMAIACYKRALDMGEDTEHIHYALGESYLKAGENTESLFHFEWVLKENPDRIDIYYAMVEVYERLEDYDQAQKVLENAIIMSPAAGSDVYYYLSHLYLKGEKNKQAIRTMEDALSLSPGDINVRRHLADLFVQEDSPYMAIFTLEQGMDIKADKYLALDLAQIFFHQERYDEALKYYQQAWKLGNFSGRVGMENVGNVYFNADQKDKAQVVYDMIK